MSVRQRKPLDYDPWARIEKASENTPDWNNLKDYNLIHNEFLVMVTGNLRRNRPLNLTYLAHCKYYGEGITYSKDEYLLKRTNYDHYDVNSESPEPMAFKFPTTDTILRDNYSDVFNMQYCGRIEGDVYGVDLRTLCAIDKYMGNSEGNNRELEWIKLTDKKQDNTRAIKAFMYLVDFEFFSEYAMFAQGHLISCATIYQHDRTYYFTS
jgi:hypothetical protein